jgi:hypothetical protein
MSVCVGDPSKTGQIRNSCSVQLRKRACENNGQITANFENQKLVRIQLVKLKRKTLRDAAISMFQENLSYT